jgi:putative intracellular protease/amidase
MTSEASPLVLAVAGVLGGRKTAAYPALAPDVAQAGAEFASTASPGLGFVTREELRQTLRQHSRGRLRLDPGTTQ